MSKKDEKLESKIGIIHAVKTPLGFFALVVLVVEAIFGVTASMSSSADRTYLILGMIAIMFLLILIVAGMAIWRPLSLYGLSKLVINFRRSIRDCFRLFKESLAACLDQSVRFRLNFLRYDSTKRKLIMYIQDDVYQDKNFEMGVDEGLKTGIVVVCEALNKEGLVSRNLPPDHYTYYSNTSIQETLSSVMAFPIRNADGNIIGVVALDSEEKIDQLAIREGKLKELFLKLCNLIEEIIADAGVKKL